MARIIFSIAFVSECLLLLVLLKRITNERNPNVGYLACGERKWK
jgi:hypothetical protein